MFFPLHVVDSGQSLVGIDLFNALGVQILGPDGEPINSLQHIHLSKSKQQLRLNYGRIGFHRVQISVDCY